ncbi:MAG: methyl-accepting chemotaxis protein [Planctomycetota bacterium]|jgi:methyl-accepting chemotaxis protein
MSIRATFLAVFLILVALLLAIVSTALLTARAQRDATDRERLRFESWKLADELRQSSDDLTRMARTYVETGDPVYERYFNDILAIRNGEQPRPDGYEGIYWDLVIAAGGRGSVSGPRVALEQRMRDLGFTEQEFGKLREAQSRSDGLVRMEEVAMNAVKGLYADEDDAFTVRRAPDPEMARQLLHGREYHLAKARIMEPIREFFELLDARTSGEALAAQAAARRHARTTLILTVVTTIVALGAFLLLQRRTVAPIGTMVERLKDIAEGEGDLTRRVDESARNELGELASWFNTFVRVVHDIVQRVASTSASVSTAATQIAAASRDQTATMRELGSSTSQIAAAVRQISATGDELARTMQEVTHMAGESGGLADDGRTGLREMEASMQQVGDATASVAEKLAALNERAGGIGTIVTTIVKVADQTDLLSVNAAIEAENAGDAGAGFHVVAREIRHLADQTADATLEIDRDVKAMQSAAAAGVKQMGLLSDIVEGSRTTVGRLIGQLDRIIEQVHALDNRFRSVSEGMTQQAQGVGQIKDAMASVTSGAERTSAALTEFTEATDHLRESTGLLRAEVGRFKLAGR